MHKRIFIYEPYAAGHHSAFIRALVASFAERQTWHTTLLTSKEAQHHPAFERLANDFRNYLDVIVARDVSEPPLIRHLIGTYYARQFANSKSLRHEFAALHRRRKFDFALVPYLEAIGVHNLAFRSHFGPVPWAVIPHGLRFHYREAGIKAPARKIDALQRHCFVRMLKAPNLAAVFTLDPYLAKWSNDPRVQHTPHPSPLRPSLDQKQCRRSLGLPEDAFIVLAYGAIDERKCLDLLLPAVAQLDRTHNCLLVIAGIQDRRLRDLFSGPTARRLRLESRLMDIDRFVSDDEEHLLFSSADAVWMYYRNQLGGSDVLVKAGQHSKPVFVSDSGLAARIVADERCGTVVPEAEPHAVARALAELATCPVDRKEMGKRAFARFFQHGPEAFTRPITAAIETV
jgi:glycosyltransferase involved in cell wall biosynthesis